MAIKRQADQSTPSLGYQAMVPIWRQVYAIMGGTKTMRDAGEEYLPRHPLETRKDYARRLQSSVFTNYYRLTLEYLVGKPFARNVEWEPSTPDEIKAFGTDMNLEGDDLTAFCKMWFTSAMSYGFAHCLVDYPVAPSQEITLQEQNELGMRPYLVLLHATDLIAATEDRIGGKLIYTHVRVMLTNRRRIGYAEVDEPYIKEYNLIDGRYVECRTFRPDTNNADKWIEDTGMYVQMDMDRIPIVSFYTQKQNTLEGRPELLDLAYLNIEHWQSCSDQRNCLTVARFPILAASGVDEDTAAKIGPRTVLTSADPQAKFYYVEHSGSALESGADDIQKLEERMAYYGAEMLKSRPDRETATSRILDSAQTLAPLQRLVLSFQSSVQEALKLMCDWIGVDSTGAGVKVFIDFSITEREDMQLQTLKESRLAGDISHEQYIAGLQELRVLPGGFDATSNRAQVTREAALKATLKMKSAPRSVVEQEDDDE